MTWREEAKALGIKMWQRKKEDVLKDIEAAKNVCKDFKVTIGVKEANQICKDALFAYAVEQGMIGAACEGYMDRSIKRGTFLNCKRKGIIFRGQKNDDDKLNETSTEGSEGSGTSEHVSEGGEG